ncbi:MAG: hypothetical protein AB7F89_00045 [Pirellulaceae bacterium]
MSQRRLRAVRKSARRRANRRGLAALEVVCTTALVVPTLFALLWLGFRAMAAFLSVLGTMIGSPLA